MTDIAHVEPDASTDEIMAREVVAVEMDAGSLLLYTGTVLHGGGANTTTAPRVGVLLHYTLNWLRQEENQYLSCPPEIAKGLDPELRSLIGYSKGGPVLGFYSDPTGPGEGGAEQSSPSQLFVLGGPEPPPRPPDSGGLAHGEQSRPGLSRACGEPAKTSAGNEGDAAGHGEVTSRDLQAMT